MRTISITYQCGHRIAIPYYPASAPQVGDVLICYECGRRQQVTATQVHDDRRSSSSARHHAHAFKIRRF